MSSQGENFHFSVNIGPCRSYSMKVVEQVNKVERKKMRLAVVGSRTFDNYKLLEKCIISVLDFGEAPHCIVSGGAKGADSLAEKFVLTSKKFSRYPLLDLIVYPPDWEKYGKYAGFHRNQLIVDNCDMVIAFWDGVSRGTKDTIDKARVAKKPTFIVYF